MAGRWGRPDPGPVRDLADVGDLAQQLARWFAVGDLLVTALACGVVDDPAGTALAGIAAAIVTFGWISALGWALKVIGGALPAHGGLLPGRRRLLRQAGGRRRRNQAGTGRSASRPAA
jgi:hypothetical protein